MAEPAPRRRSSHIEIETRLRAGTVARYAIGSVGTGGWGTLPGLVLVYYLTDTLGVSALVAGALFTLARVWDVVIDPIIGARSDRQIAATGYRRRFMVWGGLLLPILFVVTFAVPAGLPPTLAAVWVFVGFVAASTAFSLFQVPYIALPAELASRYDARTRLVSARVVVLTFAILLFGGGGPALRGSVADVRLGYLVMAAVAGVVLGVSFLITSTVEKHARGGSAPLPPATAPHTGIAAPSESLGQHFRRGWSSVRASRPFRLLLATFILQALATGLMLAAAQYIATWVLESEDAVTFLFVALIAPALVFAPLWAVISRRLGKETTFLIASVLYGLAALSLTFLAFVPGLWVYGPVALAGAAYAGLQSLPLAMLPDVIADDARRSGPGRAGTFSGVWTAGETAGMTLGTTLLTIALAATGYVETIAEQTVEQPESAILGIVVAFSVAPAVLIALSIVTLVRYPLRKVDIDADPVAVIPGEVAPADAPPASPPTSLGATPEAATSEEDAR